MGVYIPNIKMPNSCGECLFICKESTCRYGKGHERSEFCPLVEVPPHGDLVDRKWLTDIAFRLMSMAKNDDIANGVKWLWQYIIDAPTIIEAEGEEPVTEADV